MKGYEVGTTLTPQQGAMLDAMVGIYGSSKSEVLRFIFTSWITTNIETISKRIDQHRKWQEEYDKDPQNQL